MVGLGGVARERKARAVSTRLGHWLLNILSLYEFEFYTDTNVRMMEKHPFLDRMAFDILMAKHIPESC